MQKNKILPCLFLLFTVNISFVFSQNKWAFGLEVKGGLGDSRFTTQAQFQGRDTKADFEKPLFSSSIGLLAEYKISPIFVLQSGVRLIETGYTTDKYAQGFYGISLRKVIDGQPYTIDNFRSSYLELPLNLKFYPLKTVYFLAGTSLTARLSDRIVSSNYIDGQLSSRFINFVGQNGFVATSKGFWSDQFDYRDVNMTLQVGFGYDLTVFKKMILSIQPTAQYFLLTTTPRLTDYYNRRLFNFGLSVAIKV